MLYWGAQGGYSIGHGFPSIAAALPVLFHRLDEGKYPYDIVQLRWTKGDNGRPTRASWMPCGNGTPGTPIRG